MSSVAVLFGLNYPGTNSKLNGCVNDANNMASFVKTLGYDAHVFTDVDQKTRSYTTRKGIVGILQMYAQEAKTKRYKNFLIHYSGHGTYIKDLDGDEQDRRDECLVPFDFMQNGFITDDEIHAILSLFPSETNIKIIMDCCHSGTICDLDYQKSSATEKMTFHKSKKPINAKCIMISGCMDSQTSADAYNMQNQGTFSGALTTTFLECVSKNVHINSVDMLKVIQSELKKRGFDQVPQLCGSYDFTRSSFF